MTRRFAIVAPNYHPRTCGVGDHSMRVAAELLRRGIEAAIFTRAPADAHPEAPVVPVFGYSARTPRGLARRILDGITEWRATHVLLQYTPQMFDASRFGSLAPSLLMRGASRRGLVTAVLAHETYTRFAPRPDLAVGALTHRLIFADLLAKAHAVAVTTDARCRRVARAARWLGASARLRVIRVGSNVSPRPERTSTGAGIIGAFSTMTAGKRFDVLLEAFAIVAREASPSRLVLIGDLGRVPHRRYRALVEAIRAHPFADRIMATGPQPFARIAELVASLDVFFHPDDIGASTRSGTLPLAFATGVPVVAISGPETDELFSGGDNLVFATSLAPADVAGAALSLIRDPVLAHRISEGGRRLFEEHLTWSKIVSALTDDLYGSGLA